MSTQTEPKLVTQIDFARAGQITPQMKEVAEREHRDPEYIRERVADGRIAIPANIVHIKKGMRAFGVGEGLSTKVNVNLGISGDKADAAEEWKKVKIAEDFGADAIMDLSNSGKTRQFRQQLIDETPLMVGTVPMYDAIGYMEKPLVKLTKDDLLEVVRFKYPRAGADVGEVAPPAVSHFSGIAVVASVVAPGIDVYCVTAIFSGSAFWLIDCLHYCSSDSDWLNTSWVPSSMASSSSEIS